MRTFLCLVLLILATPLLGQTLRTEKDRYAPNEPIVVRYSGFPGNVNDWITLVKDFRPINYTGPYFFLQGRTEGILQFEGLPVGKYQIRSYYNWPSGGYIMQQMYEFTVTDEEPPVDDVSHPPTQPFPPVDVNNPAEGMPIYENWNDQSVTGSPTMATQFTLEVAQCITQLGTYHYANGRGVPAGSLMLIAEDSQTIYGPFDCLEGERGKTQMTWLARPNVFLPPGTYTLIDSDHETWSYNTNSGRRGFAQVKSTARCPN